MSIANVWEETISKYTDDQLETLYLKINICDSLDAYLNGNGEGVWAIPLDEENKKILDEDKENTTAKIIMFNDSVYFRPLQAGSVIQVEIRPGYRPVMDINWMDEQLKDEVNFKKDILGISIH